MHNTVGGPQRSQQHQILRIVYERWSSQVQQAESGSDVLTLLQRSRDHVYGTFVSSYHQKLFWHLCRCLLCVCQLFYRYIYMFVLFFKCLHQSCVRSVIEPTPPPPTHSWLIQWEIPCCALTSDSMDFILGGQADQVRRNCGASSGSASKSKSTKFHGNRFCCFCVILLTNKHQWKK